MSNSSPATSGQAGSPGATKPKKPPEPPGNTTLVDYGIQNEGSHLRAHVCVLAKRVYIYSTKNGLAAIQKNPYPKVRAFQPGIKTPTALGYLVPPGDIEGCRAVVVKDEWWQLLKFHESLKDTSEKGRKAVLVVRALLHYNIFPLFSGGKVSAVDSEMLQIQGVDINLNIKIQVKCDYAGGAKNLGGTGNLFLQIAECNPFKRYEAAPKPKAA